MRYVKLHDFVSIAMSCVRQRQLHFNRLASLRYG
jgi:hypothetical protein